jgi:hypothetical protein
MEIIFNLTVKASLIFGKQRFLKLNSSSLHARLISDCWNPAIVSCRNPAVAGVRQHPIVGILTASESGNIQPPSPNAGGQILAETGRIPAMVRSWPNLAKQLESRQIQPLIRPDLAKTAGIRLDLDGFGQI